MKPNSAVTTDNRRWLLAASLLLVALLVLLPFGVMLALSLFPAEQTPGITVEHYIEIFTRLPVGRYMLNSLVVALCTVLGQVLFSTMAGYAFARLRFRGRELAFWLVLVTLMIPPQVNVLALFLMMRSLGWLDTYQALVIPAIFSAYGVFLMRQWYLGFPPGLEEAARLDGCTTWQLFWRVVFPLGRPAWLCLALLAFVTSWNSFLWPLTVTFSDAMRTLPVGIVALKGSFRETVDWPLLMAAAAVSVLPIIVLFLLTQRWWQRGLLGGAIK